MKTKARVWDAAKFVAPEGAQIVVDTNVWLFMQMEEATQGFARREAVEKYLESIDQILLAGGILRWSSFSYPEVANVIESYYCDLYKKAANAKCSKKRYRHESPLERIKVVRKVQEVWEGIKGNGSPLGEFRIDANQVDESIVDYRNYGVDPYDLFLVSSLKQEGLTYILTDDVDFITVPDIDVVTYQERTLRAAADSNQLMN